jgi:hypothetical protein
LKNNGFLVWISYKTPSTRKPLFTGNISLVETYKWKSFQYYIDIGKKVE